MIGAELKDLFTDTVLIQPWLRQNANGEGIFGDPVTYHAVIDGQNRLVRDASGQQVVASLAVRLFGAPRVTPKDRVTLPSHYTPQRPPILTIETFSDEEGDHHVTLRMQ
jgi:hypothetical protein